MKDIIARAKESLPAEYRTRPWTYPGLEHGTGILQRDMQLNAYTAAYGEMHLIKCRAAFQNFPFNQLKGTIQIVDWGCGQGFGSYCAIKTLKEHNLSQWIKRIVLVEPSKAALSKAVSNLNVLTEGGVNILDLQMYCPGDGSLDEIKSIDYTCENVIHIFSNILDVNTVNIQKLARVCATSKCRAYLMCISPMNSNSYRIDRFHSIFGKPECFSQINDYEYGRTSDTYHFVSCKTKCFVYDGRPLQPEDVHSIPAPDFCVNEIVFDDYDILYSGYDAYSANLLRQLYETLSLQINPIEDFLIVRPNIDGDIVDLMVLRPSRGALIIKIFDQSLHSFKCCIRNDNNGKPLLDDNGNVQFDKFKLVNEVTGEIVISPIVSIGGYQKKFLTSKTEELLKLVIANNKTWTLIKKMVVFTKDDTAYAREFFKDNYDYTYIYGNDFLNQPGFKDGFLGEVFKYYNPAFSTSVLSSFLRTISPEWHSRKEGRPITLNTIQKGLAKSETNKSQKISGVAGSGKTLVLATRCVNAQKRTGGDVLVLTYNKTLANYVKHRINEICEDFPWSKIHISHYHKFFRQHAHMCNKHVHLSSYEDSDFFSNSYKHDSLSKYDAIFVDEVQDYKTAWLRILQKEFLKKSGEFVVFGDPKQNVYNNDLDENGDIRLGVIPGQWNHDLKKSKRYHNPQLLNLFNRFQLAFFPKPELTEADSADTLASLFTSIEYQNLDIKDSIDSLYECVNDILKRYNNNISDVSILAHGNDILRELADKFHNENILTFSTTFCTQKDLEGLRKKTYHNQSQYLSDVESVDQLKKYDFSVDNPGFKMSTIDSFKGWESPVVILIIQKEGTSQDKYSVPVGMMAPEVVYTGITRATQSLFVINLNNSIYDNFFKQ